MFDANEEICQAVFGMFFIVCCVYTAFRYCWLDEFRSREEAMKIKNYLTGLYCVFCMFSPWFLFLGFMSIVNTADSAEFRRAQTMEDAWAASCRVCVNGARGSGMHIGGVGNAEYILTNYHVVTDNKTARLDFWTNGKMESIDAVVVWRAYDAKEPEDFAILSVRGDELKKIDPPWTPLGGSDARPSVGAVIVSSGAPDGRFPQAWKGQILEYYNGKTAVFSPPPVPGQSGSAICEYVNGELFVTGVLTWLIGEKGRDDSKGGAIPVANIYKALSKRGVNVDYRDQNASPIPPNASECAEQTAKAPCVLEFTQSDCPPCREAENDVAQLRAFGIRTYVYDVATELGSEYVKRYKIERTPSFVVLDSEFKPLKTITGAGKCDEIRAEIEKIKPKPDQNGNKGGGAAELGSDETPLPAPQGAAPPPDWTTPLNLPELAPITTQNDFRNRPPVYEYVGDVGFFEDSDQRWQDLKRRYKDKDREEDEIPEENERKPRLGERLADGAIDSITGKINEQIDGIIQKMKDDLRGKWEAIKLTLLMGFCLVVVVALLIAEGIVAFCKLVWRKASGKFQTLRKALNAFKETQRQ